jgi:hypothetical protein
LGFAIPERPIFPRGFDEIYDEVLRRQTGRLRQDFGHTLEELSFLLRLPAKAHGDLNEDDAVGTPNTEILRIVKKPVWRMFRDYLKAVIRWDSDGFDHRSMNSIGKRFAIFRRSALPERNANERHRWISVSFDAVT